MQDPTCSIGPEGWTDPTMDPDVTSETPPSKSVDVYATIVPDNDLLEREKSLTDQQRVEVQDVVARFLAEWDSGAPPRINDFVPLHGEDRFREHLVFLLVTIDIQQCTQRNQPVREQDYYSSAPDFPDVIASALTRSRTSARKAVRSTRVVFRSHEHDSSEEDFDWSIEPSGTPSARYRPLKMHAKGGLGAVYQAKDSELGRMVALKRILPGREDDTSTRARFVFEAEVTGSLEHPGIVPVYGLSRYENDRPYYAMRFIKGTSFANAIKTFHRQRPTGRRRDFQDRTFRQLIRHFMDCCNALHYAHERGVLHRDIKPDNIMLGQYGETLVVDWGLAKILPKVTSSDNTSIPYLDETTSAETRLRVSGDASQTRAGTVVGTPMYMSPEQAWGKQDELTPASDVYSLGAMLFSIVSNSHAIEGTTARDVISNVREGNVCDLQSKSPKTPPALISICKKAMAYDAKDRYPSAIALADELDRWLSTEAVLAHRESPLEKATRLLRRYSAQAAIAAAAMLLITMVSVFSAFLIYNAKKNEEQAKRQATQFKSEAVQRYRDSRDAIDGWLVESSDALEYFPGTRSVRARLLTLATEDYRRLANATSDDPELELERGRALIRLGDLNRSQAQHAEARKHYRNAIELLAKPIARPTDHQLGILYQVETANAHSRMALDFAGDNQPDEADRHYDLATQQLEKLISTSEIPIARRYLGAALVNWSTAALERGENQLASERLQDALENLGKIQDSGQPKDQLMMVRGEELLGRIAVSEGKLTEAVSILDASIERLNPIVAENQDHPGYLDAMASLLVSRSSVFRKQGKTLSEVRSLTDAAEMYRSLRRAVPDLPRHKENLAITLTDLALILNDQHRCRDAQPFLAESDQLLSDLTRDYGELTRYREMKAVGHDVHAQIQASLGEYENAVDFAAKAIVAYQSLSDQVPDRPDYFKRLAIAQSHYSQILASHPEPSDETTNGAELGFETSVATLKELKSLFPDAPGYSTALALTLEQQGRFLSSVSDERANECFEESIAQLIDLDDRRDPTSSDRLAWILMTRQPAESRNPDQAIRYAKESNTASENNAFFQCTLGLAQLQSGKLSDAAKTIELISSHSPETRTGREWLTLALHARITGSYDTAREAYESGMNWYRDQSPKHPDLEAWRALLDRNEKKQPGTN